MSITILIADDEERWRRIVGDFLRNEGYRVLEAADGQTSIAYEAYYTSATQDLEKVENGANYWGEIEVNFIPMEAQVRP